MNSTETCLVIFDPEFELLGEILLQDGKCSQINLNRNGELLLGPSVTDWQTQGLEECRMTDGDVLRSEKKQWRTVDFVDALERWLGDHGYCHLILPSGAMTAFSEIQNMKVPAQKKYELALMLRDLPIEKLAAYQSQTE